MHCWLHRHEVLWAHGGSAAAWRACTHAVAVRCLNAGATTSFRPAALTQQLSPLLARFVTALFVGLTPRSVAGTPSRKPINHWRTFGHESASGGWVADSGRSFMVQLAAATRSWPPLHGRTPPRGRGLIFSETIQLDSTTARGYARGPVLENKEPVKRGQGGS